MTPRRTPNQVTCERLQKVLDNDSANLTGANIETIIDCIEILEALDASKGGPE